MTASDVHQLERLMPVAARKTNQIYMANEEAFGPSGLGSLQASGRVAYINDNHQLQDFVENCKRAIHAYRPAGARNVLENVVNASSFNLIFYKLDLAKWNLSNKLTPPGLMDCEFIVLREDNLEEVKVGELLELFSRTPPMRQPRIVFVPNAGASKLANRLCYANPSVTVANVNTKADSVVIIPRKQPASLVDFTNLFEARCFEVASATSAQQISAWLPRQGALPDLALQITRVRARLLSAERHDVESDVDVLLSRVDRLTGEVSSQEIEPLLYLRIAILLQKLYCSEEPRYLSEATGLASSLGDEFGLATCLRFAEFLDVHPAVSEHMYRKAESTFRRHDSTDLALYCKNNRLVSSFTKRMAGEDDFSDLMSEIDAEAPGLYRRHDLMFNRGVAALLSGAVSNAESIFSNKELLNGRPLIVGSTLLCRLVCEKLQGHKLTDEEVLGAVRYIIEFIHPGNRWHIANLLLNILILVRDDRRLYAAVLEQAKDRITFNGRSDVRDTLDENAHLMSSAGLDGRRPDSKMPGPFGMFQEKHGLALPCYYIWS